MPSERLFRRHFAESLKQRIQLLLFGTSITRKHRRFLHILADFVIRRLPSAFCRAPVIFFARREGCGAIPLLSSVKPGSVTIRSFI